jgi:hypothetical protein
MGLIHPPADGNWGSFQFPAIRNAAALATCVCMGLFVTCFHFFLLPGMFLVEELLTCRGDVCLLKNRPLDGGPGAELWASHQ